ncbi:MAG: D-beta-D-heptose 7-phosphate kinase / D-beta-D-heptose 1-phosphate adenosyltransferase [Candidatus Saganbacteria bacterium]|uniref:Bifunctional protein HldE n=1 Tax=Candidatus Saganbacteria bacterium TaxID=2575572 RepID=A0A833NRB2_UNCSA|nr:MAG: D-beta-D-heptose 7-phosphate kinase / D-beta-D-heptose 1-phosphate adenosyltransferase [Candidatus Saganbacteria bacterium]
MLHLKKYIPLFADKKIMVIGDLMLDEHIWSNVSRISPEAPVAIAEVIKISHVPGGCGNVAANVIALSGNPYLVGIIGKDSSAEKLQKALRSLGISTSFLISSPSRPTILKSRVIAASQHIVRVDREEKSDIDEVLANKIFQKVENLIPTMDAVILSDYGKGVASDTSCLKIIKLARKFKKTILVDPKGSNFLKYKEADILTPNLSEAENASGIKIKDDASLFKAAEIIIKTTKCKHLMITRGKDGISLFSKNLEYTYIPAVPREVFDITGAGDTVISAVALAVACGAGIKEAAMLGNYAASVKVSKIATQPVFKDELEEALEEKEPAAKKIKTRKELTPIIQRHKAKNAKIVFTNGCFDILHLGHVRYLKEAKKLGNLLIVGLNSDSSVKKLKGNERPYVSELERAEILASLECVDYVSIFPETKPDNLIKLVKPNIHVKGGDYTIDELPERRLVEQLGGKVVVIPPIKGRSTSSLIDRILKRKG